MKRLRTIAPLAAACALLGAPAVGQADKPVNGVHNHPTGKKPPTGKGNGKSCLKKPTVSKGFVVKGTLVSYTADDVTTPSNEQSVTVTVTGQNRHARRAGLADSDAGSAGTQYELAAKDDAFKLQLSGFEANERPTSGDKVRISGKVAVTRAKCASAGASLEDRYGDVNVRRVKIIDAD